MGPVMMGCSRQGSVVGRGQVCFVAEYTKSRHPHMIRSSPISSFGGSVSFVVRSFGQPCKPLRCRYRPHLSVLLTAFKCNYLHFSICSLLNIRTIIDLTDTHLAVSSPLRRITSYGYRHARGKQYYVCLALWSTMRSLTRSLQLSPL